MSESIDLESGDSMSAAITLKQPQALKFLFGTELWERFAYFAVQSILVLCMTQKLGFADKESFLVYSAFTALLFVTPLLGGYVADRLLGYTKTTLLGIALLIAGYFTLATLNENLWLPALAILIAGNGFFKPNISALLGSMYKENDPRRESGFTIFYIGINVGATIGVILCGFLAKSIGWSISIATAGSGLLIGALIFILKQKAIKKDIIQSKTLGKNRASHPYPKVLGILGLIFLGAILLLKKPNFADMALIISSLLLIGFLGLEWFKCSAEERGKFSICIILVIFSIAFWALYQQSFMVLMLYLSREVNLNVVGVTIPASIVNSLNGIFLILLAPLTIKGFSMLAKKRREPNVIIKFTLGIAFMGMGYLVLFADSSMVTAKHLAPLTPIVLSYAIQTLGELLLSPVGLAMVTEYAPEKIRSIMVGVWFFALAAATALAGQLATLTSSAEHVSKLIASHIYGHAFLIYGVLAISAALLLLILNLKLSKVLKEN